FSGAVTDGTAWAFVLNGRFVGVFDGDIEGFEDASLTAHRAPDLSLPLLYAMQARGGDVRGQYYSNDTPLSEIDDTLSSGNFVGYVELSENVLSGDYYVVYYGGRSLPVAFVGNNERLLTGDEAFERAADEVGIYSVVDADIEVVDLPERPESDPASDDTAVTIATDADAGGPSSSDGVGDADTSSDGVGDADTPSDGADDGANAAAADSDFGALDMTDDAGENADAAAESPSDADETTADAVSVDDAEGAADGTTVDSAVGGAEAAAGPDAEEALSDSRDTASDESEAVGNAPPESDDGAGSESALASSAVDSDELERLQQELAAARAEKAELEAERDRIAAERDDYREEAERLRERVSSLEDEIERLDADTDATPTSTLDPDEALSGTNLFVRYEDTAGGTLERAAEGRISKAELRDNLRLDHHTEFETDGVQIDGRPFDAFLRDTPEHQFSLWLLTSLTYEIRQTDSRADLSKLYEAIQELDRIDLGGAVDVTVEDADGGTEATTVTFDVVFRDKMGTPLFVASFDDSRDPTHAETIRPLLDRARSVSDAVPAFAAAFAVTTSFFDADAMEAAVDATRGGLFSRSSRQSYVKLSRKSGFHLCLVEARDEDFFLTVPEL
ncbi:MAG: hypothetical protein V5A16_02270, partial [Haloplanus sp.]